MTNPLTKYYRKPVMSIALPSSGRWDPNGVYPADTNDVPIMPMTAMDEIVLKTPDALLNGKATLDVFKSCCPSIAEPGELIGIDADKLLVAVRIASYGHNMDITTQCPHCNEINESTVDLRTVIDNFVVPSYDAAEAIVSGCTVKFRPSTYNENSEVQQNRFYYEKTLQQISKLDDPTPEHYDSLTKMINSALARSISNNIKSITTPNGEEVTNRDFIIEFVTNVSKDELEKVANVTKSLQDQAFVPAFLIECQNEKCRKESKAKITFDLSNFFVKRS